MTRVSGWAENAHAVSYVYRPSTIEGVREVLRLARERGLHVGLRGAGRSYGDAAMASEHLGLDLTRLNRITAWNPEIGIMTCEPGVTIQQVWEHAIEDGWWPPVVSGTMFPTVGGATAMNIHGKNQYRVGTWGEHVQTFDLLLPNGELRTCTPGESSHDLFHAAIGGFGVLGVFTSVTLALRRVSSGLLRVRAFRARNISELFVLSREFGEASDQMVGWLDPFASGQSLGRGLLQTADDVHDDPASARTLRVEAQRLSEDVLGVPKSVLWRFMRPFVNNAGMRTLSALQYAAGSLKNGTAHYETHAAWAFKLDFVPHWKRAYGASGLVQYQAFVPRGTAEETFARMLRLCQSRRLIPYLPVFKRHRPDPFLMSYSGDGYSLALDFKLTATNRPALWSLAAEMDKVVLDAGGRFYFAKDSHLHPSRLAAYLAEERVQRFLAIKRELDPENLLQTDLYRRLFVPGNDTLASPIPAK